MTTVTIEPKKRRGRPPKSKNKQREIVSEIPAGCPKCGSTVDSTALPNPRVMEFAEGTNTRFPEATRSTWRRMICKCGNHWTKQTFDKVGAE